MTVEPQQITNPGGAEGNELTTDFPKGLVVWGLRGTRDTFRHIHRHFFQTAAALGIPAVWTKDRPSEADAVKPGMLVLAVGIASKHLPNVEGASYCLHNVDSALAEEFDLHRSVTLQVYTDGAAAGADEKWGPATYFDKKTKILYQPWGTNLRVDEFLPPVVGKLPLSIWLGSVWDNEHRQGNRGEIAELKSALNDNNIRFLHFRSAPDPAHIAAIRASRLAPAIAGAWQAEQGYLPCRVFKNISYGQLGVTNVGKLNEILGDSAIQGESIAEMIDTAVALSPREREELTRAQQEAIRNFTYVDSLNMIARALRRVVE
jgi:hypothetical protein